MNVLVVHDLIEDNEKEAGEQAKKMFDNDLRIERESGYVKVDENNTWWDEEYQNGQIAWLPNGRSTYDVTYLSNFPNI